MSEWHFTERHPHVHGGSALAVLALTAEERRRSRYRATTEDGQAVSVELARGTVLAAGDRLRAPSSGREIEVAARPEPVLTVRAPDAHALMRGAYHLGNRHVMLEIGPDYLRLSPDPVLAHMVEGLGLTCTEEVAPLRPDPGAYHAHAH